MTNLTEYDLPIFDFDDNNDFMIVLPHLTDKVPYKRFYPTREFCEMLIKELNRQPPGFELFICKIEDDLDRRKKRGE